MADKTDKFRNAFFEEAYELLSDLEATLLELEETPEDEELVGRAFRALHTIKGSGSMFGFDDISKFTHEFEAVFDLLRSGTLEITKEIIDLALKSQDHIRSMLDAAKTGSAVNQKRAADIISQLKKLLPAEADPESSEDDIKTVDADSPSEGQGVKQEDVIYRIRFRPAPNIFSMGVNPMLLLSELRDMGRCDIVANLDSIPELNDYEPEVCYVDWDITLTTNQGINAIKDVFIFVEDDCELDISVIDDGTSEVNTSYKMVGEILTDRGDVDSDALNKLLEEKKRIGEELIDAGMVGQSRVESALVEQKHVRDIRSKRQAAQTSSSIRVAAEKLDRLVNLVGELVIVQARISQTAANRGDPDFMAVSEELERLTSELRDNSLGIRMLPIGSTFSKFKRLVRDLSTELGKEIVMTTAGAETELDKTVIERLNDPMVHMIRNSIDHGIEPPDVRESRGKPRQGTIHLSAMHSGANVIIQIRDDGAGMDVEAIRAKAVEKGLITSDEELSDSEIFSLIFSSGFSTAKKLTGVSGRGVGMDVVKRSIDDLRGSVRVDSHRGTGSTVTIELPLTLAIIEGLQVEIENEVFVLPLSMVEECIELTDDNEAKAHGRQLINVRGEILPYVRLRKWFKIPGEVPGIEHIVVTNNDGRRVGFVVDNVIGERQTVIKSLGSVYQNVGGISGATIQGDGSVGLILDVPRVIQSVEKEELALANSGGLSH